jgi:D-3-phosphoglycerate dehydrogenase
LLGVGAEIVVASCRTEEDVIKAARGSDALLVQWAPITAPVIETLDRCKVIVRYGIGVDNVDVAAALSRGIPVCNVPDYCIDEVADHTIALVLALARQLPQVDARVRAGVWRIVPDNRMPALREMTFGTLGLGRVARAVLDRARAFGFRVVAADPYVPSAKSGAAPVDLVTIDDLVRSCDIVSLHAPLTPATRLIFDEARIAAMKPGAILVNTGRGGLVDLGALARCLSFGHLGGAGIDVYEEEPLPMEHPIRQSPNTILTSHIAWFSESSVPRLQQMAAEEVARALRGESLSNPVNRA